MSYQNKLISIGYKKIDYLDPGYFDSYDSVGYYILFSEKYKTYYLLYTKNAKECTNSICNLLEGRKRDRAVELKKALYKTAASDWCLYFKTGPKIYGHKKLVQDALDGYRQIKQGGSRIDEEQAVNIWFVEHELYSYPRMIPAPIGSEVKDVIVAYLKRWRKTIDTGLRDRSISISEYYKASAQQSIALKEWMTGKVTSFTCGRLLSGVELTRRDARKIISPENIKYSNIYFKQLVSASNRDKEIIALES